MSGFLYRVADGFHRLVPVRAAYIATSPVVSLFCRLASGSDELVSYDGRGTIRYDGDDDERQIGRNEVAASIAPVVYWMFLGIVVLPYLSGAVETVGTLAFAVIALLLLRLVGEIEIVRVDESAGASDRVVADDEGVARA